MKKSRNYHFKTYQFTYTKHVIAGDGYTVPHGYLAKKELFW